MRTFAQFRKAERRICRERKRCDFYRGLRNFFSHPTYAPIDLPSNSFSALAERRTSSRFACARRH